MNTTRPVSLFFYLAAYLLIRLNGDSLDLAASPFPRLSLALILVSCVLVAAAGFGSVIGRGLSRQTYYRLAGGGFLVAGVEWFFDLADASFPVPKSVNWIVILGYMGIIVFFVVGLLLLATGVQTIRGRGRFALVPPENLSTSSTSAWRTGRS